MPGALLGTYGAGPQPSQHHHQHDIWDAMKQASSTAMRKKKPSRHANRHGPAQMQFSHAEFDALPYSIQKKYFSSLERLRIAEQQKQSLDEQHFHCSPYSSFSYSQHGSSRRSSHSYARSIIGLHHRQHHRSLTRDSSHRRRLRKSESPRQRHDITPQEARFFLSLPPKIRRQHFSREEQVLLLAQCEQYASLLPLDDAAVLERARQRYDDFQFDFFDDDSPRRGRSRKRRSRSLTPTRVPLERDTQQASDIDAMSPPLSYQTPPHGPSSFRRTLSLTHIPIRHSSSSVPARSEASPLPFSPQNRHQRSTSLALSGRRSSHAPSAPVFDPEATHYQDPEARKKLRMFLATPQKFDEAVEFGFPSTATADDTMTMTPPRRYQLPPITTDARNFSKDMQTFLRDDKVSFLEDDGDDDDDGNEDKNEEDEDEVDATDGDSLPDLDSPLTPSSAAGLSFRCGHTRHVSPSTFSSLDGSTISRPSLNHNHHPPLRIMPHVANREMTLRMTLTRPDLRADEDQLYGWRAQRGSKEDPWALEHLELSDDVTGSRGPFFVKGKGSGSGGAARGLVSTLFKRASRRGR
ncbi:uncharacterized protein EI97DRAFT_429243 [Westerdykella ornata]|uniref:Uncharacterized protein n=1 Tax=Westerdykella ornata TaxID=318751 RepID=A0A6A6JX36_WESOR|nr:uncharacterized protein EI97DRAFT_429243 [Westerdykella ornata]KAF2281181.1 hypothetical protein EI97DRAFT_429243 [Westerdykella ornata]